MAPSPHASRLSEGRGAGRPLASRPPILQPAEGYLRVAGSSPGVPFDVLGTATLFCQQRQLSVRAWCKAVSMRDCKLRAVKAMVSKEVPGSCGYSGLASTGCVMQEQICCDKAPSSLGLETNFFCSVASALKILL